MTPKNQLYAESHEWVRMETADGKKVAVVGITDFAVEQLSDVVFMKLPDVGGTVAAGKEFGEVESVKSVNSLYAPVSGKVVAVNTALPDALDTLKTDAYGEGWMVKIAISDEGELAKLKSPEAYDKQCAEG